MVPAFWASVEDCLIQFHQLSRSEAAEKVTDFWRRLGSISVSSPSEQGGEAEQAFDDMIYHSEPWYIACNLAGKDLPLKPNQTTYQDILKKNHLM